MQYCRFGRFFFFTVKSTPGASVSAGHVPGPPSWRLTARRDASQCTWRASALAQSGASPACAVSVPRRVRATRADVHSACVGLRREPGGLPCKRIGDTRVSLGATGRKQIRAVVVARTRTRRPLLASSVVCCTREAYKQLSRMPSHSS